MSLQRPTNNHIQALSRSIQTLNTILSNDLIHTDVKAIARTDRDLLRELRKIALNMKYQPSLFN